MTTLEIKSAAWQGAGGPAAWDAAWDRTRMILSTRPAWEDGPLDYEMAHGDGELAAAASALAMAFYLLAAQTNVPVTAIQREQVVQMQGANPSETLTAWEEQLLRLGHDPQAQDDPVSSRWRVLRVDYDEQRTGPSSEEWDLDSLASHGVALVEGLRRVLRDGWGEV
ncbi:hypothetical protein ACFC1T_09445 [Kitasatospora sp. NPDC056076]|uniref:hypothetical protein n=1 Tax=Kitasatospora sp. NPDC056076 TaxID=3345703 RepID=UPI0035DB9BDF